MADNRLPPHDLRGQDTGPRPKDTGLRRLLIWTLVALVVSILMALAGVELAIRWFDRP